jgi:hypothetical protein
MRAQLQREMNLGEELAIAGGATAAAHADSQSAGWLARATGLAEQFVLEDTDKPEQFQAMHIRAYAERHGLPSAPDARAWGHVMRRLKKKRVIEPVGTGKSSDPKQHNGFITEWRAA